MWSPFGRMQSSERPLSTCAVPSREQEPMGSEQWKLTPGNEAVVQLSSGPVLKIKAGNKPSIASVYSGNPGKEFKFKRGVYVVGRDPRSGVLEIRRQGQPTWVTSILRRLASFGVTSRAYARLGTEPVDNTVSREHLVIAVAKDGSIKIIDIGKNRNTQGRKDTIQEC